ncbi:hypothetical protein EDEG_02154 [Edhazardia aedis USNM 41457]|uniref:Uncharacterized protein n=1 Tax=Edhazardia aedis (strain USNM 41457) TaxID=1003232 RepID=J9DLP2_EDHAE|nr:hypothetical protein EDEG_02154 [Edhazardia aedis USNM 41457]|eukprot:EJW03510.1 hypothetical protein EDEG_02154 [Edhazardia aedis USNM 41457]
MMILILPYIFSYTYKIKLANTEKYMANEFEKKNTVNVSDFEDAETFTVQITHPNNVYKLLRPQSQPKYMLSYSRKTRELIYHTGSTETVETFEVVPLDVYDRTFWILTEGRCVTWHEEHKHFWDEACKDNDPRQVFEFIATDFDYSSLANTVGDLDVKVTEPNEDLNELSRQIHLQKENKSLLLSIYKALYDMTICFGNNGTCNAETIISNSLFSANDNRGLLGAKMQALKSSYSSSSSYSKSSSSSSSNRSSFLAKSGVRR